MSSTSRPLLFALQDSLMLLAPRGWSRVELGFEHGRLASLETKGEGAKEPKPRPQLHVDPREEAQRFGEALAELTAQLGDKWTPGKVTIDRQHGFADWKFLKPDGSVAWFSRLEKHELDSLLITDGLFDAIEGTERAFHDLQGQLQQRLGKITGFAFDPAAGMLRLDRPSGRPHELRAEVVGSYLPDLFTWLWSWGDEKAHAASTSGVKRICAPEAKGEGMAAFWRDHFHCDEGFAWALAGHVAVSLGARGLFRAQPPEAEGALFLAILELPPAQ